MKTIANKFWICMIGKDFGVMDAHGPYEDIGSAVGDISNIALELFKLGKESATISYRVVEAKDKLEAKRKALI